MYVRVKRGKQAFFVHVDPNETVLEVKEKIESMTGQRARDQRIHGPDGAPLEDSKSLATLRIENDALLPLAFRSKEKPEEFEQPFIVDPRCPGEAQRFNQQPVSDG